MKSHRIAVLAAVAIAPALALLSLGAAAQYVGPSTPRQAPTLPGGLVSVAEVLKNPVDDRPVVLQGHLVRKISREHYEFTDGTGTIRVEIDDDEFPAEPINEKTRVELRGEIEKDFVTSPEIDVDSVRVLGAR